MATRSNKQGLASDSGPYGGAEYRASEAKRSGGSNAPTMKEIREQLNDPIFKAAGMVEFAKDLASVRATSREALLERFNRDVGDVQFNPFRPFTDYVEKDVTQEIGDKLNTFVAYRDLLERFGSKKQEIRALEDAIRDYAETAIYYRNNLEAALESGDTTAARNAEALSKYNESALYVKNAIADSILAIKRGSRNG